MSEEIFVLDSWQRSNLYSSMDVYQQELRRPFHLLKPKMSLDSNKYCFLYGENLQEGVAGFGDTANEASLDFDKNWYHSKAPTPQAPTPQPPAVPNPSTLAEKIYHHKYQLDQLDSDFSILLTNILGAATWGDYTFDSYDGSFELDYFKPIDIEITEEQLRKIQELGFLRFWIHEGERLGSQDRYFDIDRELAPKA